MRRLLPDPAPVAPEQVMRGLGLGERAPEGRPYVVANMVSTLDGAATLKGDTGQLGGAVDRDLFLGLRTQVDAILAGTRTIDVEGYGRPARSAEHRARRAAEGLREDPLVVVVSRRGELPQGAPLFADPESLIAAYVPKGTERPDCAARVTLTELPAERLTMGQVLADLRATHDVRSLLCEGGPKLLGALVGEGLLDELFVTLDPRIAGEPGAASIVEGAGLSAPQGLELQWALEDEGTLFLRYAVRAPSSVSG